MVLPDNRAVATAGEELSQDSACPASVRTDSVLRTPEDVGVWYMPIILALEKGRFLTSQLHQ